MQCEKQRFERSTHSAKARVYPIHLYWNQTLDIIASRDSASNVFEPAAPRVDGDGKQAPSGGDGGMFLRVRVGD